MNEDVADCWDFGYIRLVFGFEAAFLAVMTLIPFARSQEWVESGKSQVEYMLPAAAPIADKLILLQHAPFGAECANKRVAIFRAVRERANCAQLRS
jgi:hypothetical protein